MTEKRDTLGPPDCRSWEPLDGAATFGRCALGWYGGRPSFGVCAHCTENGRKGEGLGDTIAKLIHVTTLGKVTPCAGCNERRERLNRRAPRRRRDGR